MGIRLKLIFPVFAGLILVITIPYVIWLPNLLEKEREDFIRQEHHTLDILANALTRPILDSDLGQLYAIINSVQLSYPEWKSIVVRTRDGNRIYPLSELTASAGARNGVLLHHEIKQLENILGHIDLLSDFDARLVDRSRTIKHLIFLIVTLIGMALLLTAILQDKFVSKPLRHLAIAARHISNGDFDVGLPKQSNDEVGELTHAFDKMKHSLQTTQTRLSKELENAQLSAQALNASENRLHTLFHSITDGIVTISPDGTIESLNPGASKLLGYQPEELVNNNVSLIMPPPFAEHHSQHIGAYGKVGKSKFVDKGPRQLVAKRKDGTVIPIELTVSIMHLNGKLFFVGLMRDISDRIKAESERNELLHQLQQVQKMEAVGNLTGGIAHDFNNMLTAILGYNELAMETHLKHNYSSLTNYLSEVGKAGMLARNLVQQMLAFSRHEAGEAKTVAIGPIVDDAVKMLHATIPSSIGISSCLAADLPKINTDPVKLHQIIMNLVINARDALDGKGSIDITTDRRAIVSICNSCHEKFSGDFVTLTVKDNGTGVSADVLQRMFDPFYTTKATGKGTGMGLSVVHGIVHAGKGHILVTSTLGKGSEFTIALPPINDNPDTTSKPEHEPTQKTDHHGTGNILIVDDEVAVGSFLGTLLETRGYDTTVLSDSALALKQFKLNPENYDLVITDQTMPNLTGAELAKELLDIRPQLPIILCTGHSEQIDEAGAHRLGLKKFIHKPIDINLLLSSISQLLNTMAS